MNNEQINENNTKEENKNNNENNNNYEKQINIEKNNEIEEDKEKDEEEDDEEIGEFAIAGAGLAGLALALRLQQEGRKVHIYERDLSFNSRAQGYSISMQPGGKAAFKKLNLFHKIEEYPCRSSSFETLSSTGNRLFIRPVKKVFFNLFIY